MNTGRGIRDRGAVQSHRYDTAEHRRRIENVIRVGRVFKIDYKAGKCRVRVGKEGDDDKIESDWIPWSTVRHGNNRRWDAPEKDEQVLMISPSGDLVNAFVLRIAAYDKFQNEAQRPSTIKETYRTPQDSNTDGSGDSSSTAAGGSGQNDNQKLDALEEFHRDTGQYWFRIKEIGGFHWQVGPEAFITLTDKEIQIGNRECMFSMTKDKIGFYVQKDKSTIVMTPDGITAQVQNTGIWKLTKDLFSAAIGDSAYLLIKQATISLALSDVSVGLQLAASSLKAMVKSSIMQLQEATARMFAGASEVVTDSAGVIVTSPTFQGNQGSAPEGEFDVTQYQKPDDDKEPDIIQPPKSDTGYPPYRPAADSSSSGTTTGGGG